MTFFEQLAQALDDEGIESRVHDDTMFVPITSDIEIHFVEIDPHLPAANVYIAAADVDEDDDDFEAALTSVVFSVDDAVATVAKHVATDQVVTVLQDLLEGTDERIADLEFYQDPIDANLVHADVGEHSDLQVMVEVIDGVPSAIVQFVVFDSEDLEEFFGQVVNDFFDSDGGDTLSDEDREKLFLELQDEASEEVLDLGVFTDFDLLFDVLSLAADQADSWEQQLLPFDSDDFIEPEVYDIFGEDDFEDEFEDFSLSDDEDDEDIDEQDGDQ